MTPDPSDTGLASIVPRLSGFMLGLDTGPLARLRRIDLDGPGTLEFWHLASEAGFLDAAAHQPAWMQLVRIMALQTPRGERTARGKLHNPSRHLGAALCDGGNPDWRGDKPMVSETRLARLITTPIDRRGAALERLTGMIIPGAGFNCTGLASLLFSDRPEPLRRLAQAYYQRLDRAPEKTTEKTP